MKKGLIIFSLATLCVTSQAQEGWTLRQCIDYAIEHNIEIQQTANEAEQNAIEVNTAKWARAAESERFGRAKLELGTFTVTQRQYIQ